MERTRPGSEMLEGAVDCHVHACPHLNARCLDVFQAARQAADAGMRAIGLMDNFANSAGLAALAMRQLDDLGVEVFGGLIMEPPAGGVTAEAVRIALDYGYGPGTGARFISLPTHHTRAIALQEARAAEHVERCLAIPETGPLPDPLPEILDIVAARDVVLNTGHIAGLEALRVVEAARARGVERILVPCSHYDEATVAEIARLGAYAEFSFFFVSHATQIGLTHVDSEQHTVSAVSVPQMVRLIRAATPERTVVSSDCGVFVLPPPVEGLREFLLMLEAAGISRADLRAMSATNPTRLFKIGESKAA